VDLINDVTFGAIWIIIKEPLIPTIPFQATPREDGLLDDVVDGN